MMLVSSSQAEFSDGMIKNTFWISREAMPGNEHVEHSHCERQIAPLVL
jgi:hypothetical protein